MRGVGVGREWRVTASGYLVSFWGDDSYSLKEMMLVLEQRSSLCIKWLALSPFLLYSYDAKAQGTVSKRKSPDHLTHASFFLPQNKKLLSGLQADSKNFSLQMSLSSPPPQSGWQPCRPALSKHLGQILSPRYKCEHLHTKFCKSQGSRLALVLWIGFLCQSSFAYLPCPCPLHTPSNENLVGSTDSLWWWFNSFLGHIHLLVFKFYPISNRDWNLVIIASFWLLLFWLSLQLISHTILTYFKVRKVTPAIVKKREKMKEKLEYIIKQFSLKPGKIY